MKNVHKKVFFVGSSIAVAALIGACGGGGGGGIGLPLAALPQTGAAPAPSPAPSTNEPCFVVPASGKTAEIALTTSGPVPISAILATLTGTGVQPFEGQSYPSVDVRSRIDQIVGSDKQQTLYMLPDAQFLPAGAVTHPATGSAGQVQRYAYSYLRMTLEQLRDVAVAGKVDYVGPPKEERQAAMNAWLSELQHTQANNEPPPPMPQFDEGLGLPGTQAFIPAASDFPENTPVNLLMLQRTGKGEGPISAALGTSVTELTVTNAGREDVTVGGVTHAQACKLKVAIRRGDFSQFMSFAMYRQNEPELFAQMEKSYVPSVKINDKVAGGTAWFAPGVGLVKAERVPKN